MTTASGNIRKRQSGFSLVAAIFILVIVALLGAFMVTMSIIERSTSSYAVQGARAYHAAVSGVEWGIRRALAGNCVGSTTFPISTAGLSGFNVTVQCSATSHMEPQSNGASAFNVFVITSTASTGAFGTPDYFSRSAEATVTNAVPP